MNKGLRRSSVVTAATAVTAVLVGIVGAGSASAAEVASLGYDPVITKGALWNIKEVVQANAMNRAGFTGKGIGVALIDTGVTKVPGLDTGNVTYGPDLSFDSQDPDLTQRDSFGHGTHLASIIAGRDAVGSGASYTNQNGFYGVAPDTNLVSVKVGSQDGAVDVSQVIAAIDWVVEHKDDKGLNIRVIALAYGTDAVQASQVDPLTFAAEQAWKAGITVVTAGGNDGRDSALTNPAESPYLLTVGAEDSQGTVDVADDVVPDWVSGGTAARRVDVVAPGVSVLGTRVPDGYADVRNPLARVGTRFAKASGTSQATAVVAGEVALLLQAKPGLTPDQVKLQLGNTAKAFPLTAAMYRGNGLTQVNDARVKPMTTARQPGGSWSTGLGSLEGARGTVHVNDGTSDLVGESDIFGNAWVASDWTAASAAQSAWVGGKWRGARWTGDGWTTTGWLGSTWRATTWSGSTWKGSTWKGSTWKASTWSGSNWSGSTWSARSWR